MNSVATASASGLGKEISKGLWTITLPRASYEERFITATPAGDETVEQTIERAIIAARRREGRIVAQEIFAPCGVCEAVLRRIRACCGEVTWPITWLDNGGADGLAGSQVWAISGKPVTPVRLGEAVVGSLFEDEHARYVRLGGIVPLDTGGAREVQARHVFDRLEVALGGVGMDFSNVVRTWFYNDDILAWYGAFNQARDTFFRERGIFDGLVPASTGIGGANPEGAALSGGLLALAPKTDAVRAFAAPSPLQCPALEYGSSFSRAAEIAAPDCRRLYVSGTASIEPGGDTLHVGDMAGQVKRTMQVVAAILGSRGMTWDNAVRGIAYLRNAEDAPAYAKYCASQGLPAMPTVVTKNVICRDDLLFELEVDAVIRT